ncbi:diguanylate cyclase [Neptuniibacter sp. 1_MG-2023]|uniref:diguanylate cyclase domain-containing protein n=1 Tax=Neptuniibacter sp. 1_MG-2023 TaxID=3062662 RepID=UPI0026E4624F|nr:diguanylate cyclase [Neptuniibacter sp. 1_MG-2023]MDO6594169.1 diguanylate cyclase [Neptuniibacter sp. 1_MG-2023]
MLQYTVYADLNCPFCYALHEQLHEFGLLPQVDWRLVEHAPDIAIYNKTAENQAELASDVFVVRSRVPHIDVALPQRRSDSHFANLCVIQAAEHDLEKSIKLRHLLYRALWIDGLDIADVPVIYDCLIAAGLPAEVTIEEAQENLLAQWQKSWEDGNFNLRIPVICSSDGRTSLGLPSPDDLKAFFKGEEISTLEIRGEVKTKPLQQTIAIYCDHNIENIWPLIASLRNDYNILLPSNLSELKQLLHKDHPALLMLSTENQWDSMFSLCRDVTSNQDELSIPVAFINQENDDQRELEAYNAGASDFMYLTRPAAVLQSRIQILMQMKQSQDKLARSARIDGLTQVNNRREFDRSIDAEWRRAQRSKRNLVLLMLDVDHFKSFNDQYGHLAGDGCLRTIAQAIKKTVKRAEDSVYRYGGEEFAVILPESTLEGAKILAEKVRANIEALQIKHLNAGDKKIVTVSIGIASCKPSEDICPNDLIEQTDRALYKAKELGRNRVILNT